MLSGIRSWGRRSRLGREGAEFESPIPDMREEDKYGSNKKDKLDSNKPKSGGSKTGNTAKDRKIDPEDKGR